MIFTLESIWEPCSKEEYEEGCKRDFFHYRMVSIYKHVPVGIMAQLEWRRQPPIGYRYEKKVGEKRVALITSEEAKDEELMKYLRSL